ALFAARMSHNLQRSASAPPSRRRGAVVGALLAIALAAHAGERRYYFDGHDSAANLAQHTVNAIFQDHAGYVWIATRGGLNSYDGYRYRLFQHDVDNPASLPDDFVTALTEDAHYRIWLGSSNRNVASLDPVTGHIAGYALPPGAVDRERRNNISALAFDHRHSVWVGSAAGIEKLDTETGARSVVFSFPPSAQIDKRVSALLVAGDGTVWAATSGGVMRIAPETNHAEPVAAAVTAASALAVAKG